MRHRALAATVLFGVALACAPPREEPPAPPARPERRSVASYDGVEVVYTDRGDGPAAIVFVHGWSCDRSYWEGTMEAFAPDLRVVAIDLPGHGESGTGRTEWDVAGYGRDVAAVVDALDLRSVILVGHSMGGPVALEAARHLPGRVAGVIGVDTFHDLGRARERGRWDELVAAYGKDFVGTCRGFVESMFPEEADSAVVARVRDDMCAAPPEVAVPLLRGFPDVDLAALSRALEAPLAAVNGTLFPTNLESNRGIRPGFALYLVEGSGHFPMFERPERFRARLAEAVGRVLAPHPIPAAGQSG